MASRPLLVILLVALLGTTTAACGSSSTSASAAAPARSSASPTSAPTSPVASDRPVATSSTRTVTVTVTSTPHRAPAPSASAASFAAFAGEWVGHTRDLTISQSGRLEEHVGDGCCDPIIDLVLQLSDPHRTAGAWVATTTVVSARPHAGWKGTGLPAPKPGDLGSVTIGPDHVLVDSLTGNGFCDPDKTAPGTCGA